MDYSAHILAHLLDEADTINAKFVWQRLPEDFDSNPVLKQLNEVSINLSKSKYEEAFEGLSKKIPEGKGSEGVESLRMLV